MQDWLSGMNVPQGRMLGRALRASFREKYEVLLPEGERQDIYCWYSGWKEGGCQLLMHCPNMLHAAKPKSRASNR